MKLYIVQSYIGQYEDARTEINGIFDTPQQAEAVKREIEAKVAADLDLPEPPYEQNPTDNENEAWLKWCDINCDANQFGFCKVTEYELNKRIK